MKMNIGSVNKGYHFISFIAAEKPMSNPPLSPHSNRAATTATNPIAPNTRCPVSSISIMVENMRVAIIS